ncbi:MAG: dephospho-CoA kinase [Peptococcaceae bacterium]|jgi:dephospho-CoA kinase|nr:dephospho-CoA kinase [Peptococcaceae bacterium]
MKMVGLTGGIASGKSTAARQLEALGAVVIDADQIAREVVTPRSPAIGQIVEAFGDHVIDGKEELKRDELARIIFSDAQARERLNAILHPLIHKVMMERFEQARQMSVPVVVMMVPLLYEGGMESMMDEVWVVSVDEETQYRRLMARDHITSEEAGNKIASQMPLPEKVRKADVVIDNSKDVSELCKLINRAWRERFEGEAD